ncbi:hypothetical protein [Microbacterium sp. LWH12-1.2]|uniref:hypothetical protein n=1 Tax=Microbacterium sp. LWH12-1.2 TaxID=3135259 RepID=UPI00341C6D14
MSHIDAAFNANHVITRGKTEQVMIQTASRCRTCRTRDACAKPSPQFTTQPTWAHSDQIEDYARKIGIHGDVSDAIIGERGQLT